MFSLIKKTFAAFMADDCLQMAAALSYYTSFALAPLLVVAIAITGVAFDPEDVKGRVRAEIEKVVGPDGANQVEAMIAAAERPEGKNWPATLIGASLLLLGAVGLVTQLQKAVNRAWKVAPDPERGTMKHFLLKRLVSLAMLLCGGFLLLVSLLLTTAITVVGEWITQFLPGEVSQLMLRGFDLGLSLLVISILFAAMFKVLPDARVAWSDVAVGAIVTAILFIIGKHTLGIYLGSRNMDSAFGAAGSLALILLWVYYSAIIFLLGAEFTQAWAQQRGRGLKPRKGAVQIVQQFVRSDSAPSADSGSTGEKDS